MARRKNLPPKKMLSDEQVVELRRMAKIGLSEIHISLIFGMDKKTLAARMEDQEGVRAAWELGQAEGAEKVLTGLWRLLEEGNPAAHFFWCKTRLGWRETNNLEVKGTLSIEQLLAELDEEDAGDGGQSEPE